MRNLQSRITINLEQCGGRPCIRGMRIRVVDVLDLLAQGLTTEQILEEMPDLEQDDIYAVLQFAARCIEPSVLDLQGGLEKSSSFAGNALKVQDHLRDEWSQRDGWLS
ncbi:DUF433 domain-containing protein [Halomonas sp. MCCC 1A11062]|uniref:DUF433 domain-containing protein n=1 Tax=Halomonas sp. MCCC 1A11062 TaxID=2733485 RepID=UPI001F419D07|nr:DUF433 domain-containing protein [Halomonas sp. MCCC 1A11062]MCE8038902.1 DUF433 domain-containing protein [Halomonas sp. MCCC 1A11062]